MKHHSYFSSGGNPVQGRRHTTARLKTSRQAPVFRQARSLVMTGGADGDAVFDIPEKRGIAVVRQLMAADKHCFIGDDFLAFGTAEVVPHKYVFAQLLPRIGGVPLPEWIAFVRDPQRFG